MVENSANELLARIEDRQGQFSKGQKRLADYVVENYDKAVFLTAAKLGEVVGVLSLIHIWNRRGDFDTDSFFDLYDSGK